MFIDSFSAHSETFNSNVNNAYEIQLYLIQYRNYSYDGSYYSISLRVNIHSDIIILEMCFKKKHFELFSINIRVLFRLRGVGERYVKSEIAYEEGKL